jgi:hypothetical protein
VILLASLFNKRETVNKNPASMERDEALLALALAGGDGGVVFEVTVVCRGDGLGDAEVSFGVTAAGAFCANSASRNPGVFGDCAGAEAAERAFFTT